MLVIEHHAGLAQQREGLGRELEPHDMRARRRIGRIVGVIAGAMIGDQLLDLAKVLARGCSDPCRLRCRRCDAGQLADSRERQLIDRERGREPGQRAECPCDPQPVLRGPRCILKHAFEIVERGHHAERPPDL
ncbi:MAG: hypothetical protein E6J91_27855 [Deltaproteobacteria bacterium]|nr:MAG: hypothetical protein E6J91_27855 [Deltaproteobacteria bacterium]